jgi:zinc protease
MRHRGIAFVAVLAGLVVAPTTGSLRGQAGPQEPPPSAGLVIKGKAPVSKDLLKIKLPKPQEADLPSGLHLMVLEDHRLPRITFQIIVPGAGGYFDPPEMVGLSGYMAQVMREGTKTRSSQQISQELETMAASLTVSGSTSGPNASVFGSSLTENFDALFALTADVLLNPAFANDEWDRLKTRARTLLTQQRSQPGFLASEQFARILYGDHPAARISATPASLETISREALVEAHRTRFVPDHAVIAFAGDITLANARKLVTSKLDGWKKSGAARPAVKNPPVPGSAKVYLVARPNSVQTTMMVGAQSIERTDPDYVPLTVANRVLGGPMGRLFRHLREQKGYTYGVGSGFSASGHRGTWQASTNVRTAVTDPALTDLLADIAEMRDKPIPENELLDTKRAITGSYALALENPSSVLSYYLESWQYGLPKDYWDTYPARINAVTAEQVQGMAKKYWDPARLQIVAVGDASQVTNALKAKGTLEVYDTDGKPVK